MPAITPDQIKEKALALRKKLAEKAGSIKAPAARTLRKRIRRLQRRRRKMIAAQSRAAGGGKAKKEA